MKHSIGPEKRVSSRLSGMSLKAVCAVFLVTLSFFSYGQSPEIREALRLINSEQPAKGMAVLEKLGESDYYRGLGYIKTGKKDKALEVFQKAFAESEKDGLAIAGIGHVKMLDKNVSEAKVNFDRALQVSKNKNPEVMKAVARGYMTDSKFVVDAINLLNKARSLNSADPQIHLLLGDAYLMQNNGGESVSSYERAASADPKLAIAFYKVAKVYQRSKNEEMVMENLNKAIKANPEFAPAYQELAQSYYLDKKSEQAVQAQEKYLSLTETNKDEAKYQLAFYYFLARQFEKSNAIFKDVLSSPNAPAVAYKYAGLASAEQSKDDTAKQSALATKELFDKYFEKADSQKVAAIDYAYYGNTLLKLGEDSLATVAFSQGLELDSAQADILQILGDTYLKSRKFDKAVDAYKRLIAIRSQPLSQDLWSIGRAYYYNEQFMEADTAFTQLAERQPTVIHGFLWAAKSRAQVDSTGSQGIAIPMYEKFIEIAEKSPEKNKRELIDAYDYLGRYTLNIKDNVMQAKTYYDKILQLDPSHPTAQEFMKILKQGAQQQKGK
ncbi:MAG TPA: tetratricopeptide repeat protein [Chryseosolibacter sp.]|nr:tetratricopeptide repeat protein [Chryseosolibacter sp.]